MLLIRKRYFTFICRYGNIMPAQITDDFASFISDLVFGVITMSPPFFFVKAAQLGRFLHFLQQFLFFKTNKTA